MADVRRPDQGAAIVVDDLHVTYDVREERQARTFKRALLRSRSSMREIHAVRGVSFEVSRGEAVGLVGANGSGKTTLLRAVGGLLRPNRGRVLAQSVPVLLALGPVLNKQLSGRRNVYLGGTALGFRRREIDERFNEIVAFAGLEDFIDVPLRAFSSGMTARLRFAIATSVMPEILLVDELLSVGDAAFRQRSEDRMASIVENAGSLLIVSHNLRSVARLCNRGIWLEHGQIVMDGPIDEVIAAYAPGGDSRRHRGTSMDASPGSEARRRTQGRNGSPRRTAFLLDGPTEERR